MRNRPINPAWRLICRRYQLGAAAGCGDGDGRRRQWRSGSSTAMGSDWRRCNRRRRTTDEGETAALHSTARMAAVLRATAAGGDWRRCARRREPAPLALTDKSTAEDKIVHERWERCNRMALVLIKNSISIIIRGAIPDSSNAKTYLASVEELFKATSKAHASTLILKMVTTKYDRNSGIREHIMMMNDMACKLKGLDMEISEGFLKVKWSMNELIAMCVQEEERLKLDKPDVAYLMTANPKKRKGNVDKKEVSKVQKRDASASSSSKNSKGKSYCKFCRKEGHRQKDCQDFKEWLTKKGIHYHPEAGKKPKNT
ncbi:unnamed protein product [Cuscuta campestris]|uniref:CCHC-type domain-containing protein n=1 Tax=Cuscuta campestris TaxID=132261 RepID=A0A484LSE9_9ASTE|nr:unnamed protein product [Cuscuta campestris]